MALPPRIPAVPTPPTEGGGNVVPLPRSAPNCTLVEWRPTAGDSALIGRCTIRFAGGWTVAFIPIFRSQDGSLSAGVPSMPQLGSDGTHMRDQNGKKKYAPIISFADQDARARWNAAVLSALNAGGIK